MDLEDQVAALTDLTFSTNPSTTDLTQYLKDGVVEVVNRIIELKPQEINKFSTTSADTGSGVAQSGRVFHVMREHDSTTVLRSCARIDSTERYEATNVSSLHYRTKFSPGYYQLDGKIFVVPIGTATGNNRGQVSQVHYDQTVDKDTAADGIVNFPYEYEYLVVLFASMRSLQNKMGSMHADSDVTTAITATNTALDRISDSVYNVVENHDIATKRFKQAKDGLDNAFKLFDGGFPNALTDTKSFIELEDPEMIKSTLEVQTVELAKVDRALAEISTLTDVPLKEAQGYMAEVTSRLGLLSQDYGWYDNKYKELKAEYDGAFSLMAPRQQQTQGAR